MAVSEGRIVFLVVRPAHLDQVWQEIQKLPFVVSALRLRQQTTTSHNIQLEVNVPYAEVYQQMRTLIGMFSIGHWSQEIEDHYPEQDS